MRQQPKPLGLMALPRDLAWQANAPSWPRLAAYCRWIGEGGVPRLLRFCWRMYRQLVAEAKGVCIPELYITHLAGSRPYQSKPALVLVLARSLEPLLCPKLKVEPPFSCFMVRKAHRPWQRLVAWVASMDVLVPRSPCLSPASKHRQSQLCRDCCELSGQLDSSSGWQPLCLDEAAGEAGFSLCVEEVEAVLSLAGSQEEDCSRS